MRVKRNLSIASDVDRILGNAGNASAWVEHLVRDADQEWRAALAELDRSGWTGDRIREACTAAGPQLRDLEAGAPLAVVVREYWRWNEALHRALGL